jgi:flagellar motor switch/type III secretory pathway protein FliN
VNDLLLDPAEMEAIQAAIRETMPRRRASDPDVEPTRLALLADDRIAESARPVLMGLATRSVPATVRGLRPHVPGEWQLDVIGAEIIDGSTAKEALRGGWIAAMRTAAGTELVVTVHGTVVDIAAARRCGATTPSSDPNRNPSPVAIRLFQPAGRTILDGWTQVWRDTFSAELAPVPDLGIVSRLIEARTVARVSLQFSGAVTGRVAIYAHPEELVPRPSALAAVKETAQRIANALSYVRVEVIVELGTLRLRLRDLRRLERGAQFTLNGFVDSRVPVYCGGVLKAWGRPVVTRGVLAVQIETVVHGQGGKT